jgi:hypothetical protein
MGRDITGIAGKIQKVVTGTIRNLDSPVAGISAEVGEAKSA